MGRNKIILCAVLPYRLKRSHSHPQREKRRTMTTEPHNPAPENYPPPPPCVRGDVCGGYINPKPTPSRTRPKDGPNEAIVKDIDCPPSCPKFGTPKANVKPKDNTRGYKTQKNARCRRPNSHAKRARRIRTRDARKQTNGADMDNAHRLHEAADSQGRSSRRTVPKGSDPRTTIKQQVTEPKAQQVNTAKSYRTNLATRPTKYCYIALSQGHSICMSPPTKRPSVATGSKHL